MVDSYDNSFTGNGTAVNGYAEYNKTGLYSGMNITMGQHLRTNAENVLEPISIFTFENPETGRYKTSLIESYQQVNNQNNEFPRNSMVPSKSMPLFPNFLMNDMKYDANFEPFDVSMVSFTASPAAEMKVLESSSKCQFEQTLVEKTASLTKLNQETLTYLNQGQCYEIRLKCLKGWEQNQCFKSIIRVVFHERRFQYSEKELLDVWRNNRPGERVIDIDIPECCGLINVEVDPHSLNSIGVVWSPEKPTGIFVKIHCISTEFTQNQHGGEKGVPLRIKVETFQICNNGGEMKEEKLVHCASCQIKVFKPKGADRKHKRDVDKLSKMSQADRNQFRIPEKFTPLIEMSTEQDQTLPKSSKITNKMPQQIISNKSPPPENFDMFNTNINVSNMMGNIFTDGFNIVPNNIRDSKTSMSKAAPVNSLPNDFAFTSIYNNLKSGSLFNKDLNNNNNNNNNSSSSNGLSRMSYDSDFTEEDFQNKLSPPPPIQRETMSEEAARLLLSCIPVVNEVTEQALNKNKVAEMNPDQLAMWLKGEKFGNQSRHFEKYSGQDLMFTSKEDLMRICGTCEGIRLYNLLHSGSSSIYVTCQSQATCSAKLIKKPYMHGLYKNNIEGSLSQNDVFPSLNERMDEEEKIEETSEENQSYSFNQFDSQSRYTMLRSASLSSVRVPPHHRTFNPNTGGIFLENRRRYLPYRTNSNGDSKTSTHNLLRSRKVSDTKIQPVFHPIELENLTVKVLKDKLSVLHNIPVHKVSDIYLEQSGNKVIVYDEDIKHIPNQSSFQTHVARSDDSFNEYAIFLKYIKENAH